MRGVDVGEGGTGAVTDEQQRISRRAVALQVGGALQHQGFHVGGQGEVGGGEHRIGALVEVLGDHVAGIVDEVAVVAGAAGHDVGTGSAVEEVVAGVPVQRV